MTPGATTTEARVRRLAADERAWANERYAEIGFALSGDDDLLVVAEVDGARVGLGRLVPLAPGAAELGGIYVLPEYRGRAIARRIVDHLVATSPYPRLFCIPFTPLERFYRSCGFGTPRPDLEIPQAARAKVSWCEGRYPDPVCLLVHER